jgi:D-glycero-alpha-D-manno-heptose 1-phosphate guanylyltransferase
MECVVLAGGLGTRLQSVIGLYPKCMALVNGQPFLHYIFDYLEQQQCTKVILSLGFKHEVIIEWLQTQHRSFTVDYVIEKTPLGTGGGISLALTKALQDDVAVLNGDTMFRVDMQAMFAFHRATQSATTLALKPMQQFERYGVVKTDDTKRITAFEEKKYYVEGLINGGVYIVNKKALDAKQLPEKYSFEKDYFEAFVSEGKMYGFESDAYFIDIGIPTDYEKAQADFKVITG